MSAESKQANVDQFNRICPVGAPVVYWPGVRDGEGRRSVTRSEAWLMGGHTPVVMVDGYPGGIALTHVMSAVYACADCNDVAVQGGLCAMHDKKEGR